MLKITAFCCQISEIIVILQPLSLNVEARIINQTGRRQQLKP